MFQKYFFKKSWQAILGLVIISLFIQTDALAWQPESKHQWPMFHGNYNHTGFADVKGPRKGELKWKFKAGKGDKNSPPPNSVAINAKGVVFLGSEKKIYAIKPSGKLKWAKRYSSVQGPALSADGKTVYIAGQNRVIALQAKNGLRKWTYKMNDSTLFGPTIGPDGIIYQGSWDSYLYAIKPNGKLKWKYKTKGAVSYPSSIDEDGTIYLGGGDAHAGPDSNLYALKPNGKLKWKYDTKATRVGSPAIGRDGLIYVPAAPTLFVLNKNGTLEWKKGPNVGGGDEIINDPDDKGDIAGIITPAIAKDGTIYIGNSQGLISAINPKSQAVKWTYQTGADPDEAGFYGLPSFPVVDKTGALFIGSVDRKMYALNKNGVLLWSYETGARIAEAAPALGANGTLYFTSDDGYLYAIAD